LLYYLGTRKGISGKTLIAYSPVADYDHFIACTARID